MITVLFAVASASMPASDTLATATDVRDTRGEQEPGRLDDDRVWLDTQIINGEEGTRDEWPMAGGLLLSGTIAVGGGFDTTGMLCSSTLIAPDVVLIAAHCLDTAALELQTGGLEFENEEFYWTRKKDLTAYQFGANENLPNDAVRAVDVVLHEDFNLLGMQLGLAENSDIALMFLEEPVLDVPLGYLPQPDTEETQMEVDEEVVVVGWGQRTQSAPQEQPAPGSYGVKYMGTSHIADKAPFEFKVGEVPTDVRKCHGDSGGPSFKAVDTDSSDIYRVVGVTSHSWDFTDCVETGGVDTRVSFYLDWIDEKMRDGCADGTRSWCEIEGIIPPPLDDGTVAWEIPEDVEEKGGCACSASPTAPWGLGALGLAALALVRRRR